jgi:DNA-3-methyladenine glycosylase
VSFDRALLERPATQVAPLLLGAVLTHAGVSLRITEVEAYLGGGVDPGSHAFRGQTRRNSSMFGPPGRLYAYFTYGMHVCANVVCSPDGEASAVLIRGGEIVEGIADARFRRTSAASR